MGLVHIGLNLKYKGGKILFKRINLPGQSSSRQGGRGHLQEMLQEGFHTKVSQGRTKKYRRQVSSAYPLHIKLICSAV